MIIYIEYLWETWIPPTDELILTEDTLVEMARVSRKESGLNLVIFASRSEYGTGQHYARIKVSNIPGTFSKNDNFSVSISDSPRVVAGQSKIKNLDDVFDWVILNKKVLIDYWNGKYESDVDFSNDLKKI